MTTETNYSYEQQQDVESHVSYGKIWFILLIVTIAEYLYATFATSSLKLGFALLVIGLLVMAVYKARLVALYFMHLKWEGRWVYYMLIPAGILATVLVCGLTPDVALHPVEEKPEPGAAAEAEETSSQAVWPVVVGVGEAQTS
jgi:cytochrome c oxidase subunit 4